MRRSERPGRTPSTVSSAVVPSTVRPAVLAPGDAEARGRSVPATRSASAASPVLPGRRWGKAAAELEQRVGRPHAAVRARAVEGVRGQPRRRRPRPALEREGDHEHGEQRGDEGRPVDPRVEHGRITVTAKGGTPCEAASNAVAGSNHEAAGRPIYP